MSSISFPSSPHGHSPAPSDPHVRDLYGSAFEGNGGFHMNPLSTHPPRTPRASHASTTSQVYGSNIYEPSEKAEDEKDTALDDEPDEEDERVKAAAKRVRREEVWRDLVMTSNGRDKAFKLIQYSIRLTLLFHTAATGSKLLRRPKSPEWETELVKRFESTASGLSFTRKLLLMFNWLSPLTTITAEQAVPYSSEDLIKTSSKKEPKTFLQALLSTPPPVLLEFVHAISDDVHTLSLLGLLGKGTGDRAGRFSDWCWFFGTLVGLVENSLERDVITNSQREVESRLYKDSMTGATAKSQPRNTRIDERELARLQREDYWLKMSRTKLLMDLIFVSYDLLKIRRGRKSVKTVVGLTAAILSAARLYDRQKTTLIKSLKF